MTPQEFRQLLKLEREKEAMARKVGVSPDVLDGYTWTIDVLDSSDADIEKLQINWSPSTPPEVTDHGNNSTLIGTLREHPKAPQETFGVTHLTPDQQARVVQRFNEIVPDDKCSVCGGEHGIGPFAMRAGAALDSLSNVGEIWAIVSICEQCGYLREFSIGAYDLEDLDLGRR